MKVIIAEKPSVAKEIAKIVGATISKDGYYEGNNYQVTYSFGHLFTLSEPHDYKEEWKNWDLNLLPMIPTDFKLSLIKSGKNGTQFKTIKNLIKNSTEVINAGDAGFEGELIQRYILEMAGYNQPHKRLWINSLTTESIKKGLTNLKSSTEYDNLYQGAKVRAISDWQVGINGTRAITCVAKQQTNDNLVIRLGRVQSPVHCLVTKRYLENINFKPQSYYEPLLTLEKDNIKFKATLKTSEKIFNKEDSIAYLNDISSFIKCCKSENKKITEKPKLLHDLTSLQRAANTHFGYTAQETLDIIQNLYEKHKVVTYPRTDSQYLSEDIYKELPQTINKISKYKNYDSFIGQIELENLPKNAINDKEVSDHHAIIPTGIIPTSLNEKESVIYDLISKQFLIAFSPNCLKEITNYEFVQNRHIFTTSGTVIKEKGWRLIQETIESEKTTDKILPIIKDEDEVSVVEKQISDKKTKGPQLFTEATLLRAMETAGKEIEDEEIAKHLKENGIGRPSTRANIIEKIIKVELLKRDKKNLIPTELGIEVYNQIKDFKIASAELTGIWEKNIQLISKGELSSTSFLNEINDYTNELIENIKSITFSLKKKEEEPPLVGEYQKKEINYRIGKFGAYLQFNDKNYTLKKKKKPSLEEAINLIKSKESIGEYNNSPITIHEGKYGHYLKNNENNYSIPKNISLPISLEQAITIINSKGKEDSPEENKTIKKVGAYELKETPKGVRIFKGNQSAPLPGFLKTEKAKKEYIEKIDETQSQKQFDYYQSWLNSKK